MTAEQIRTLQEATPFQPFRVHMANGRHLDVPHPDFMHLSPTGRKLVVTLLDDSFEIVDVLLVTSVESLPGNSKAKRRTRPRRKS